MSATRNDIPELAFVRVLTAGGPYRCGDLLSLAFVERSVGRLASHEGRDQSWQPDACVPETISVAVTQSSSTYAAGDDLTLSFIDPHVVRIHAFGARDEDTSRFGEPPSPLRVEAAALPQSVEAAGSSQSVEAGGLSYRIATIQRAAEMPVPPELGASYFLENGRERREDYPSDGDLSRARLDFGSEPSLTHGVCAPAEVAGPGVIVRLQWTVQRVRRFIALVDKLFTIERLGWYRHVLAMRLLVPEDVILEDAAARAEALQHLHALRTATAETLGKPLLAAFMPNFNVSAEWLESLDSSNAARALSALRETLRPYAADASSGAVPRVEWTVGDVLRADLVDPPACDFEALLASLIPHVAVAPNLGTRLRDYRRTLLEAFGQTAGASSAVRLGAMTTSNHALDDRLWQLVGAAGEAFAAAEGDENARTAVLEAAPG